MDEKQALLCKEFSSQINFHKMKEHILSEDYNDMSSEDSDDEWWEEADSECSSCCDLHSVSSLEWETEITENGQLFYVQSDFIDAAGTTPASNSKTNDEISDSKEAMKKNKNSKKGRILNWMKKRECKKLQVKKENENFHCENQASSNRLLLEEQNTCKEKIFRNVILKIDTLGLGNTFCEKLLGLSLGVSKEKDLVVMTIAPQGPAKASSISVGDIICKINNTIVTPYNVEHTLQSLNFPCEVEIKIQKMEEPKITKKTKFQSIFVQSLLKKNEALDAVFLNHPIGVVVVDIESQNLNKDDVIYCYPEKSILSSCRGAFVTLFHLLAEIKPNDLCQSSSVIMKGQSTHILYNSEGNYLLLIAIPQARCTLKEATFIVQDLIRNLLFNHQNLKRCFETSNKSVLDHFFSLFFSRLLANGFSGDASQFLFAENISNVSIEPALTQFEDIMPYATWVPLPKEVQVQIDEALNELEANDFEKEEEENIENQRLFNILGSCLFHRGYLLASHLPKDDLLDVYTFYRQNCLIQLFRNEPVKSLIIWREVFPFSVNRGQAINNPSNYPIPRGRWFLLIVSQGYDSLAVILEAGEFCKKISGNLSPVLSYVEEAQDTLRHMQKLGISTLALQWIERNARFKTVSPEEVFVKNANRKKENLLGFVKTLDGTIKTSGKASSFTSKSEDTTLNKKSLGMTLDTSEDSVSQTPSNVSEISDENAPILGRRAERYKASNENIAEESDSSDSDWESSKDSNMRESREGSSSSANENFYLYDVNEVLPVRLTTGPEDILFYYVHLDGNEGMLMSPPLSSKKATPKMKEILQNFRRCAQIIHTVLENNIKFKKNSHDNSKSFINKSLVAVKEHGVIFECFSSENDSGKKQSSFSYWIVGRLFFTPQPREIYVCFYEDAPQNLVEIAFRLGLSAAG